MRDRLTGVHRGHQKRKPYPLPFCEYPSCTRYRGLRPLTLNTQKHTHESPHQRLSVRSLLEPAPETRSEPDIFPHVRDVGGEHVPVSYRTCLTLLPCMGTKFWPCSDLCLIYLCGATDQVSKVRLVGGGARHGRGCRIGDPAGLQPGGCTLVQGRAICCTRVEPSRIVSTFSKGPFRTRRPQSAPMIRTYDGLKAFKIQSSARNLTTRFQTPARRPPGGRLFFCTCLFLFSHVYM